MKKCPECGTANSDTSTKCVICGKSFDNEIELIQPLNNERNFKSKLIRLAITIAVIIGLALIYNIYINYTEKKHISMAEEAVLADNANFAVEEYKKIPEKSKRYSQAQQKIEILNSAVKHIEKAKKELSKKNYMLALNESREALALQTGLPMAETTDKDIKAEYVKYLDGLIENDDYKTAVESLNNLDNDDKWEEIENIEKKINIKINSLYEDANTFFNVGSYDSALNALCAAVNINPNWKDPTNLNSRLAKTFADSAFEQFQSGNVDNSIMLIEKSEKALTENSEALAVKNQIVDYYINLGNEKLNADDADAALVQANAALRFVPGSSKATELNARIAAYYVEKGNACLKNEDFNQAIKYGQLAKDVNPKNEWAPKLINEATIYNDMLPKVNEAKKAYANGNYDSALNLLTKAFNSSPYIKENYQDLYNNVKSAKDEAERIQREIEANPIVVDEFSGTKSGIAVYEWATIRNRSSRPVNYIKAVVELLDDNKEIINTKNWYFRGETLYPGEHVYLAEEIVDMGLSTRNRIKIVDFRYAD
ncbi:MAG: hypothetical protein IKS17_10430 [Firmicutes bacterium]|nr:hypothetical protein [Bacillota bacterium]